MLVTRGTATVVGSLVGLGNTTDLIQRWQQGDQEALSQLTTQVYAELRARAAGILKMPVGGAVLLQPTELVNECFLKLVSSKTATDLQSRAHFMAVAAKAMRQILTDQYRYLQRNKRAGQEVTLVTAHLGHDHLGPDKGPDLFDLDRALSHLQQIDPSLAELVEMKYFTGMSIPELAQATGQSEASVKRHWRAARVWLAGALEANHG